MRGSIKFFLPIAALTVLAPLFVLFQREQKLQGAPRECLAYAHGSASPDVQFLGPVRSSEHADRLLARRHSVCIGMSTEAVKAAWGLPLRIAVKTSQANSIARWEYEGSIVTFHNETVNALELRQRIH